MPSPAPHWTVEPGILTPWDLCTILEITGDAWPGKPHWTALPPGALYPNQTPNHQQRSAKHTSECTGDDLNLEYR